LHALGRRRIVVEDAKQNEAEADYDDRPTNTGNDQIAALLRRCTGLLKSVFHGTRITVK